ncbi:hypothetical protein OOT33_13475 [Sphingobium sp. DEHP117]|uniref:hypothetical protein n=1 Tax=Sphingobium sp. DEHP117 TaxID=2993436 RepID=UPI0027D58102|nr:hypothetical protein [Sphingobium sp. DEHP117]MDQ4421432.1 hypothetical protein [Sphingobium sp. DEHP117]
MAECVHLIGAEDVVRAGSAMSSAADQMQRAASSIEYSLEIHRQFLNDWLSRLDGLLTDRISDLGQTMS